MIEFLKTQDYEVKDPIYNFDENAGIDVYIPEKKFAIDLLIFSLNSENIRGKTYFKNKLDDASKNGIRLLQIYEDEWENHKEIILSKIKSYCYKELY